MSACSQFRATVKGNLCRCGYKLRDHAEDVQAKAAEPKWGWRARHLAQPDAEECE